MPSPSDLNAVLAHIDADIDGSLERLFALVRIKSISADPAFAGDCKAAAEHLAKDIASLGFATDVRQTGGHPAIVGKSNGSGPATGPRVLFYGHYDVQPVDPLNLWEHPPFEPAVENPARRPQGDRRARRAGRQGPAHDLRRGLPRLEGGDGRAAAADHDR